MREIGFGLTCGIAMAVGALLIAAWPVPGRPMAAFFPVGTATIDIAQAISGASGSLLQIDSGSAVAFTMGDRDGFVSALYGAGAWLVIDAAFARLCTGSAAESDR
ncbi:hypothetical protein [uncultured Bosea sp.]|uniref:hypothetical protein n=1 Tax=uncultured Bosea sp. TaxID=211457 RepID=UPI00263B4D19|nr:hypothetical protein [uncultured Bosea sp.]